jgi:hypothetical protein
MQCYPQSEATFRNRAIQSGAAIRYQAIGDAVLRHRELSEQIGVSYYMRFKQTTTPSCCRSTTTNLRSM